MLSCSWDAEAYYMAWLRDGIPFYGEDQVRGLQLEEYGSFSGTASVTTNFAAQSSTLQVTDAFFTDSANYTCAVTCRARQVVKGEVLEVSEEFSATREVLMLGEWTLLLLQTAMLVEKCSYNDIYRERHIHERAVKGV